MASKYKEGRSLAFPKISYWGTPGCRKLVKSGYLIPFGEDDLSFMIIKGIDKK